MSRVFQAIQSFIHSSRSEQTKKHARSATLGLDSQKDVWILHLSYLEKEREGEDAILNLFSLQCLLISCSPDPRAVVLNWHYILHSTEPFTDFFPGKIWLRGNFLLALLLLLQLIKTDNLMKITGIDLFYYLPSIFYNFYNDDFCLILLLCRAKSDGKSVALRPFYQQFLPQDHGGWETSL